MLFATSRHCFLRFGDLTLLLCRETSRAVQGIAISPVSALRACLTSSRPCVWPYAKTKPGGCATLAQEFLEIPVYNALSSSASSSSWATAPGAIARRMGRGGMHCVLANGTFGWGAVTPLNGSLFAGFGGAAPAERFISVAQGLFLGRSYPLDRAAGLALFARPLVPTDHMAVVRGRNGDFGGFVVRGIGRHIVHHVRRLSFFARRRIEEETRWGVCTATPPDLPGGRAVGSRNSLRGFSGRSDEKRAGAVVEYLGRAVSDIEAVPSSRRFYGA